MDIVYLFKDSTHNDSAELRYSLRSLQNINHNKVFIVGEKPSWVTNVEHIPVAQDSTRYENVARNLWAAVNTDTISSDFIMMNDDFFIIGKHDAMPTLHWGYLHDVIAKYNKRYGMETDYLLSLKYCYAQLAELGFKDPLCYELHTPIVINKSNVKQLKAEVNPPYHQFRTLYGNYFQLGGEYSEDVKVFIDPRHNNSRYARDEKTYLMSQSLLSATGGSFARGRVGQFIRERFPDKSSYEL